MEEKVKRLFFAFKVIIPPFDEPLPYGKVLEDGDLHATLVFMGQVSHKKYNDIIKEIPKAPFSQALFGIFDELLFLPTYSKNVVAYHILLDKEDNTKVELFKEALTDYLKKLDLSIDSKPLLLHTTLARKPFDEGLWQQHFQKRPLLLTSFCLYESLGNRKYKPLYEQKFHPLFEEVYHTADIAYTVYGHNLDELYINAQRAISFWVANFFLFFNTKKIDSLDDIIYYLNQTLSIMDIEMGCPLKAVSMHGQIEKAENNLLKWQMIIDV